QPNILQAGFTINSTGRYTVTFQTDSGPKEYSISRPDGASTNSYTYATPYIFLVAKQNDQGDVIPTGELLKSAVEYGHVVAPDGRKYAVIIERNTVYANPLRVLIIDQDQRIQPFFSWALID